MAETKGETRDAVTLQCEGQKMFGILHLPKMGVHQKFPSVLLCHGFGGNKSGKFRLFVRLAQRLAESGIASFRFDFRGSGDSEGDFQDTSMRGLIQDAKCALDWLKNHPAVDAKKIGILGSSLGGIVSIHTLSNYASNNPSISAITLWAPVFDAKPYVTRFAETCQKFEHLGVPVGDRFIEQFTALDTADALQALDAVPLLHIQGVNDKSIEKYHKEQYEAARRKASGETKFISLEKSEHDFADRLEQELILQETASWFQKYLF